LSAYVRENKIPIELKKRLQEYFYYQKELLRASHYTELLELMTPTLRGEVAVSIKTIGLLHFLLFFVYRVLISFFSSSSSLFFSSSFLLLFFCFFSIHFLNCIGISKWSLGN